MENIVVVSEEQVKKLWSNLRPGSYILIQSKPVQVKFFRSISHVDGVEFCFSGMHEANLKSSSGFEIEVEASEDRSGKNSTYIRLTKLSNDEVDIFVTFCTGLIGLVQRLDDLDSAGQVSEVCDYIAAWQKFMKTPRNYSVEKEVGLHGELIFLEYCLRAKVNFEKLKYLWQGPNSSSRDFVFSSSTAVEVKTSIKARPFIAKINSINQLDTSECPNLYVAAVSVLEADDGVTIVERIDTINSMLASNSMRRDFEVLLLSAGFNPKKIGRSLGKYKFDAIKVFKADTLPRITPTTLPGVVRAIYDISLINENGDIIPGAEELSVEELFNNLTEVTDHE